jgi:hypothetical protein
MDANQIIDALGGTNAVARLCECTPASVSGWRKDGIPKPRLMYLRAVRPDAFAEKGAAERSAPASEAA